MNLNPPQSYLNQSQVTQDEMSSEIPALDQTSSSKCHKPKGLTINNGPEAKDKSNNSKKKEEDNKVKDNKIKENDARKNKNSISSSSSSSDESHS